MTPPDRSFVVGAFVVLVAGCAAAGHAHNARLPRVSPCGSVSLPTTWSPGGKHIAWYGYRWPLPPLHHRSASVSVLRAICISDAEGKHVRPLRYTVCSEHCSRNLSDPPDQLDWAGPRLLLYGSDLGIFAISLGRKPELLGRKPPEPFSADAAGDRV